MPAVGAAIGAAWTALTATAIGSIAANLLTSVAVSALATALQGKPDKPRPAGVQTRMTTTGDSTCQSLIFGRYATAGNHVCPPMTHGSAGGTPNAYMTQVIDVSDLPVAGLDGLWIDDQKVTLGPPAPAGALFPDHQPVTSAPYNGKAWVRFYDGTQTSHSESLTTIGAVERPWQYDMIGRGVAYAILRFKFDDKVFRGMPEVLFEVDGIGFYDPRKDSSMGGSGPHRWGERSTYEPSENPVVQIYNVLRGIDLPGGGHWGGRATAGDLPLANWFAAMNECDVLVDGEPQYRTSYEVRVGPEQFGGSEPAGVVEDLLRCCSGQVSEFGGTWRIRVGPVGMPVAVLTDDDIIITEDQTFLPFPSLRDSYNAIQAQYPEPAERWASKEAPPIYNPAWEARDGGRRRIASLSLGACPYPAQVQRIMQAYIKDEQRDRVHEITLPPDYAAIEPLDAIAWTSDRNGYTHKVFEVGAKTDGSRSLLQRVSLRERDPEDYDPGAFTPVPSAPVTTLPIAPQAVPGWAVQATTVKDGDGKDRRPAIQLSWASDLPDVRGIEYEIRVAGRTDLAAAGSTQNVEAGGLIVVDGILPATQMQARGRLVAPRETLWTGWEQVLTSAVLLGESDIDWIGLSEDIRGDIEDLRDFADVSDAIARMFQLVEDPAFSLGVETWGSSLASSGNIVDADPSGPDWRRQNMPAEHALRIASGLTGNLTSPWKRVSEADVLDLSVDYARGANSPVMRARAQFADEDKTYIGNSPYVDTNGTGSWLSASIGGLEVPGGAAFARFAITVDTAGSQQALITNASLSRRSASDRAIAEDLTLVAARTDRATAAGLLRVQATATPSGAQSRIAISAQADDEDTSHSASLFLEARTDGTSQVLIDARRFAIVNDGSPGAPRNVPFIVQDGRTYIDNAYIRDLSVDTIKISNGALTSAGATSAGGTASGAAGDGLNVGQIVFTPNSPNSRLIVGVAGTIAAAQPSSTGVRAISLALRLDGGGPERVIHVARAERHSGGGGGGSQDYPGKIDVSTTYFFDVLPGQNTLSVRLFGDGGLSAGRLWYLEAKK